MSGGIEPIASTRVTFVADPAEAPPSGSGSAVVVVDTAWVAGPGDRPDLRSVRPAMFEVIEGHDLFEEALRRLDEWALAAGLADGLIVEGVTYWYRVRETMWRWLHERLIWRYTVGTMFAAERSTRFDVPAGAEALADVLRQFGRPVSAAGAADRGTAGDVGPSPAGHGAGPAVRGPLGWLGRFGRRSWPFPGRPDEARRREAELDRRVASLSAGPDPRIVILTTPATHTRVGAGAGVRDPHLGSVIERLDREGRAPILVGMGLDHRDDAHWRTVEQDGRLLPQSLLLARWADPADRDRAARAVAGCEAAFRSAATVPLEVDGVDLGPPLVDALRAALTRIVTADVLQRARVERFLAELRPAAVLLTQEGIRTPWLVAAARAGTPVFAVQHGILYPTHPGYADRRHPALVLPSRTFVYGPSERRVLLDGAYRPDEVEVSGAPRLDLDAAPPDDLARDRERVAVRAELGVAPDDRLLVVSTLNLPFVQRSHFLHMLARILGGPLPGVHVVLKQHPGERDEGPYRRFLLGLATAGGYPPPPIGVIRDIDLYRLLRAADAHLGLHSTVLTDAVVAGTPNLIAMVEEHGDLAGYVAAGVATPVAGVTELLTALADPRPQEPAARSAFLADHFLAGDAGARIVASIRRAIEPATDLAGSAVDR
jgi:hypothetical protein